MSSSTNYAPAIAVGMRPEQVDAINLIQAPIRLSATLALTNQAVLQNIAPFVFTIGALEEWVGEFWLDVGAALATTGVVFAVTTPAGAVQNIAASLIPDVIGAANTSMARSTASGGALTFAAASEVGVGNAQVHLSAWIVNGAAAGVVQVQFAQATSSGTTLGLRLGSYGIARRIA